MDLDSLLKSIREENKGGAIVPAKFFGEDRYDKYYNELITEGRIEGENLSPDERKEGRKLYKKGKIDFETFVNKVLKTRDEIKKQEPEKETSNLDLSALPGSATSAIVKRDSVNIEKFKSEPVSEGTQQNFDDILNGIDSILDTLREENKLKKKESRKEARKDEEKKRKKQEDKLEKNPFKKLGGVVDRMLKPVKSLWEKIWNFIWNVFLGRTLMKLIDWFSDKENKGKLDAIGVFLKNTWPGLLAAFLVFGTGLGGFIKGLISLVGGFAPKLAALIPKMLKGLKTLALGNPLATAAVAGAALFAAGKIIPEVAPGTVETDTDKKVDENVKKGGGEQTATDLSEEQEEKRGERNAFENFSFGTVMGEDAEYEKQKQRSKTGEEPLYRSEGGGVPKPKGTDVVPAMLTPGEFIMSRGAVEKYGTDTLESMNAVGGGTNRPQKMNGVTYANEGGMVGEDKTEKSSSKHRSLMRKRGSGVRSKSAEGVVDGVRKSLESDMDKKSKEQQSAEKANAELLSFISKGEGGYNSMNQGTSGGSIVGSTHNASSILGKNLTEMTVGEVMEHQESGKLFAAGRYQIIPSTMKLAVARAGVSPDDQFSQSTQDKLGLSLIYNGQRPRLSSYLRKESDNLHGAMEDLAMEWASAPHPDTGRSYYPPANKSSHTVEEVKSALTSAREGGAGKYMSAAPVSSLRNRGSGMRRSGSSGSSGGETKKTEEGGGYLDQIKNLFLGAIGSGGGSGRSSSSSSSSGNVDIRPNKPAPDVGDANDGGGSLPLGNMKLGQNSKKSAPEPPSQSQPSVSQISETQRRRNARRSTGPQISPNTNDTLGSRKPVPTDHSKSKVLGLVR